MAGFTGHHHTQETREKIRLALIGSKPSVEARANMRNSQLGRRASDDTRAKLREKASKRPPISDATRAKFRSAKLGKKISPETIEKIRVAMSGDKHWNWKGGKSQGVHQRGWRKLAKEIRLRDEGLCQYPRCYVSQLGRLHSVHHIDYNPGNNDFSNLITLCSPHHAITTTGDREYWTEFYQELQAQRGLGSAED